MTQNFTVVEAQTEKKGVFVGVKDTVQDVRAILDGKVDTLVPEDLLFIGTLKDVEEKLEAKRKAISSKTTTNAQALGAEAPAPVAEAGGAPAPAPTTTSK